jgi:2-dehydropantoate 2-reductase
MAKVLIYGAGAIGSFLGYLLSDVEVEEKVEEVKMLERKVSIVESVALLGRMDHIQRIRERGLEVSLAEGESPISIQFRHSFSDLDELAKSVFAPEVVFVTVKTHALPMVLTELRESGLLDGKLKDAEFVLLMNGMGNRERFDLPDNRIFEGITSIGVVFSGEGRIELKGRGKTVFEAEIGEDLKKFLEARLSEKGFQAEFAVDFRAQQWMKLFANAVINPITALTREENGIVLSEHLAGVVEKIVGECVAVAEKEGQKFDELEVLKFVRTVAKETSANTSSMLQDVLRGRRTEIDSINGYVLDMAAKHDMEVLANETLRGLMKAIETREAKMA